MADAHTVTNNEAASRYEIAVDGGVAFSEYRLRGTEITFTHTEVPEALEGRGIGSALARFGLDDARARGLTVVPRCPFVREYIERHREYLDIVEPSYRARIEAGG